MTLRDQIRSDQGRICSRITAWDQALWWGTGEFVIVLDSCCISIGLVFIKDRPVSSFWVLRFRDRVLRFRDLGVFVFEFWVLRFRDRVLRFRVLGASFSRFGCFVFEFWVLRASVFVFECFVFETTGRLVQYLTLGSFTKLSSLHARKHCNDYPHVS